MSTHSANKRRKSRRNLLTAVASQVLTDSKQRTVYAKVNRTYPCIDCDYVGIAVRDLMRHYDTRSKYGFAKNGERVKCFVCDKQFCTRKCMESHHTVEHNPQGSFAMIRRAEYTSTGQSLTTATTSAIVAPFTSTVQAAPMFTVDGNVGVLTISQNQVFPSPLTASDFTVPPFQPKLESWQRGDSTFRFDSQTAAYTQMALDSTFQPLQ